MCSDCGGIDRVQRFITLASHTTAPGWLTYVTPGCVQMRPDSPFLQQLNQDAIMLEQLNFTSIWTPFDLMIVPATVHKCVVKTQVPVLHLLDVRFKELEASGCSF